MRHKKRGKQTTTSNARPWENRDTSKPQRLRNSEVPAVTEGLVLYALMKLEGRRDREGEPLATALGIWRFINKEFGVGRFSGGMIHNALDMLEKKGTVVSHTKTQKSEPKNPIVVKYYGIARNAPPDNVVALLQLATEHWKREKKLAGKN